MTSKKTARYIFFCGLSKLRPNILLNLLFYVFSRHTGDNGKLGTEAAFSICISPAGAGEKDPSIQRCPFTKKCPPLPSNCCDAMRGKTSFGFRGFKDSKFKISSMPWGVWKRKLADNISWHESYLSFSIVSVCDLAREMESISRKNRTTEVKTASQMTLLQADHLSVANVTLPNSTITTSSTSAAISADNMRLHTASVLTTSTSVTTENGNDSYLQIAQAKGSFDEDSDSIVSTL